MIWKFSAYNSTGCNDRVVADHCSIKYRYLGPDPYIVAHAYPPRRHTLISDLCTGIFELMILGMERNELPHNHVIPDIDSTCRPEIAVLGDSAVVTYPETLTEM
ncbi:hypothetical protein GCM10008942_06780 [Rhizomicrobium electricum]|uniref:Uncharacterized protein n=1 Tax=Rhizomicrobium electricum TaxID=480070 RepID=A0ABP3PCG5_9PROT|nr:hypothetical protein [Rhizomicrobium electricum]